MDEQNQNDTNQQSSNNILKDLGLENLPEEEKNNLITQMAETLQNRISTRVVNSLTDEQKEALDKVIEEGDDKKIGDFIATNVPSYDLIATEEYERFRAELIQQNEAIKEMVNKKGKDQAPAEEDKPEENHQDEQPEPKQVAEEEKKPEESQPEQDQNQYQNEEQNAPQEQ